MATIRSSFVDNDFGEAVYEDGGAGLVLKVRAIGEDRFEKGDRVVLLEKSQIDNTYRVMSEKEHAGQ